MAVTSAFDGSHKPTGFRTVLEVAVDEFGAADYLQKLFQCDGEGGGFDYGGFHNDFSKRGKVLVN